MTFVYIYAHAYTLSRSKLRGIDPKTDLKRNKALQRSLEQIRTYHAGNKVPLPFDYDPNSHIVRFTNEITHKHIEYTEAELKVVSEELMDLIINEYQVKELYVMKYAEIMQAEHIFLLNQLNINGIYQHVAQDSQWEMDERWNQESLKRMDFIAARLLTFINKNPSAIKSQFQGITDQINEKWPEKDRQKVVYAYLEHPVARALSIKGIRIWRLANQRPDQYKGNYRNFIEDLRSNSLYMKSDILILACDAYALFHEGTHLLQDLYSVFPQTEDQYQASRNFRETSSPRGRLEFPLEKYLENKARKPLLPCMLTELQVEQYMIQEAYGDVLDLQVYIDIMRLKDSDENNPEKYKLMRLGNSLQNTFMYHALLPDEFL